MVTDNGSNIVSAYDKLKEKNPGWIQVCCTVHVLQMCLKQVLDILQVILQLSSIFC